MAGWHELRWINVSSEARAQDASRVKSTRFLTTDRWRQRWQMYPLK
jgi:hypothetical protein